MFSTVITEIPVASFAFVETSFNASVVYAIDGVAIFALYENEACKYFSTTIAGGSENSATNYDQYYQYQTNNVHFLLPSALDSCPNSTAPSVANSTLQAPIQDAKFMSYSL